MKTPKLPWTPKVPIPDLRAVANRGARTQAPAVRSALSQAVTAAQADRLLRDLMNTEPKSE
jgi:hypothetical protein